MIGEIKRHIRDDGMIKVSRSIKELSVKIHELRKEYLVKGIEIKVEQMAQELDVSIDDILLAIDSSNAVDSIDAKIYADGGEGKGITIFEKIGSNINEEEQVINKMIVKKLLDKLDKRDRQVIMLRFFKEKTQTEVAKVLRNNASSSIKN